MAERKVINKYFPPDFDPALIARGAETALDRPKAGLNKVRLMAPFSMQCSTCGDYIYKGKKFNARKEKAVGENYLGIQIFRFFIRCPRCSAEITFKTDPQRMDYVCEMGAQRNFEPWRDAEKVAQALDAEKEEEEAYNPMKALENRTAESKREMDILDALDEIRTRNARNERVDADAVIEDILGSKEEAKRQRRQEEEEEDEAAVRAAFHDEAGEFVKRVADVDGDGPPVLPGLVRHATAATGLGDARVAAAEVAASLKRKAQSSYGIVLKRKTLAPAVQGGATRGEAAPGTSPAASTTAPPATQQASALALLGAYSASDSE